MSERDSETESVSNNGAAEGNVTRATKDDDSDDGWHLRTWELFVKSAKKGILTPDEFVPFAKDLGVECDVLTVRKFLRPEHQDRITFDAALKLLENIPLGNVDEESIAGGDDQVADVDTVELGPLDYLRIAVCGGARDPNRGANYVVSDAAPAPAETVRYTLRMPQISPQFWLVFNSAAILTIITGSVIALIAVNWVNSALSLNDFYQHKYQDLSARFIGSFSSNSLIFSQNDLLDQAQTMAVWAETDLRFRGNDTTEHLLLELRAYEVFLRRYVEQTFNLKAGILNIKVSHLEKLEALIGAFTVSRLSSLLDHWAVQNHTKALLFDMTTNQTYYASEGVMATPAWLADNSHPCMTASPLNALGNQATGLSRTATDLGLDGGADGFAAYTFVRSVGLSVCVTWSAATLRSRITQNVAATADIANRNAANQSAVAPAYRPFPEIVVMSVDNSTMTVTPQSTLLASRVCTGDCDAFFLLIADCYRRSCMFEAVTFVPSYDGYTSHVVLTYIPSIEAVVAMIQSDDAVLALKRQQYLDVMGTLVDRLDSDMFAFFGASGSTGKLIPLVTKERYPFNCANLSTKCARLPDFDEVAYATFRTGVSHTAVRPNASFQPVIVATAKIPSLGLVLGVERAIASLNVAILEAMIDAVNHINGDNEDSTIEIQIIRPYGSRALRTFDPNVSCSSNEVCNYVDGALVFRSSCPYCVPQLQSWSDKPDIQYLTKLSSSCAKCNQSNPTQPAIDNSVAQQSLKAITGYVEGQAEDRDTIVYYGTDYRGRYVRVTADPLLNFSATYYIAVDRNALTRMVLTEVLIFVGVALGFLVIGLASLVVFSQRTLAQIEDEWRAFQSSIDAEKSRLDQMINELVPAPVIARHRANIHCVTETHSSLSFAFVDLCNFSEKSKIWPPRQLVRSVAYFFHLYDLCAKKFDVFRLRSFGDVSVYVAGLVREGDEGQIREAVTNDAFQMGKFAGYITQLLSPAFGHYPQRLPQFQDATGGTSRLDRDDQALPTVRCRIGLHNGPAHSGSVDLGKTPVYELYGPSLAITQRMQATAQVGRVNVSASFKELIESVDSTSIFEFDALRKTVVKGRGAISSYPIKSLQLSIDEVLLHQLKVEHAQRMHVFANKLQFGKGQEEASEMSSEPPDGSSRQR